MSAVAGHSIIMYRPVGLSVYLLRPPSTRGQEFPGLVVNNCRMRCKVELYHEDFKVIF